MASEVLATKINHVTITQPATGSTLTIAEGKTLTISDDTTLSGKASQADQETSTSEVKFVTPAVQQYHPSAAKFWLYCAGAGTGSPGLANYNITSFADTGTGILTITIATDFSSVNWCCQSSCEIISDTLTAAANVQQTYVKLAGQAAGTVVIASCDRTATTNVLRDPKYYHVVGFGDQ
jgi:hypothetical protein